MHFVVGGRREIERGMTIMTPYVVISISDPGSSQPRIPQTAGLRGVLYLKFHDAEPIAGEILPREIRAIKRTVGMRLVTPGWKKERTPAPALSPVTQSNGHASRQRDA